MSFAIDYIYDESQTMPFMYYVKIMAPFINMD